MSIIEIQHADFCVLSGAEILSFLAPIPILALTDFRSGQAAAAPQKVR